MTDSVAALLPILAKTGQPDTLFAELDRAMKAAVGHQLFTLLYVDGLEVARCYSNRPTEYPVSGRKPMGTTPWGDHVLKGREPYLGPDKAGIRWAFFDHELIESMGLGSTLNIPVVYDGVDAEHHYRPEHVPVAMAFAPLLIPAFLQARRGA
jgi:hypothetical protein